MPPIALFVSVHWYTSLHSNSHTESRHFLVLYMRETFADSELFKCKCITLQQWHHNGEQTHLIPELYWPQNFLSWVHSNWCRTGLNGVAQEGFPLVTERPLPLVYWRFPLWTSVLSMLCIPTFSLLLAQLKSIPHCKGTISQTSFSPLCPDHEHEYFTATGEKLAWNVIRDLNFEKNPWHVMLDICRPPDHSRNLPPAHTLNGWNRGACIIQVTSITGTCLII